MAIFKLMDQTATDFPPADIVDAYIAAGGGLSRKMTDEMWKRFGTATATAMADGARTLALIWESAWAVGKGNKLKDKQLQPVNKAALQKLYEDPNFVRSLVLDDIVTVLK